MTYLKAEKFEVILKPCHRKKKERLGAQKSMDRDCRPDLILEPNAKKRI